MQHRKNKPLVKNAADAKQVKSAGIKSRLQKKEQLADMRALLEMPQARRFFWRFLSRCGLFSSSYDPNPNTVYFKEGARNIGLELMAEINRANPTVLVEMMTQQATGDEEDDDGSETRESDTADGTGNAESERERGAQ